MSAAITIPTKSITKPQAKALCSFRLRHPSSKLQDWASSIRICIIYSTKGFMMLRWRRTRLRFKIHALPGASSSAASRAFRLRSASGGSVLSGRRSWPVSGPPRASTVGAAIAEAPGCCRRVAEGGGRAPGWTSTSLACTPCSVSSRRGVSTSATTHYTARCELGGISVLPVPSTMEHADPGGVSWTNRCASLTWWSRSAWSRPAPRGPPWHGQHQLLVSPPARFSSSGGSSRPSATC